MENNRITTKNPSGSQISILSSISPQNTRIKPLFKCKAIVRYFDIPKVRKYKPKMLSSVTLSSLQSEYVGAIGLRNLTKAVADSKSVSCLHLENPNLNVKQFSQILNVTNHWTNISFDTYLFRDLLNQELRKSFTRLNRCKNISTFPFLTSSSPDHINRKIAGYLFRQLKGLNKLTSLSLSISLYENKIDILKYKPPRCLTNLTLSFENNSSRIQHHLPYFISNIQQRFDMLESLSLNFERDYDIQLSDAQVWASFFKNSPRHLEKLSLRVTNQQVSVGGIKAFTEALRYLKQPKILNLAFSPSIPMFLNQQPPPLTLDGLLISLFSSLQSLIQLEELELHIWRFNPFPNPILEHFTSMLQCLKNLKNLRTGMPDIESIPEGLVTLSQGFKELSHLKVFDLTFSRAKVSSQDIRVLSNNLTHLDLTSLSLNFGYLVIANRTTLPPPTHARCSGIFGKLFGVAQNKETPSLVPFFSDLSQFNQLSHLDLLLSTFYVSTQEFQGLSLTFNRLDKLSCLSLDLPEFDSKNNFEGLRSILSAIKDLPKLTDLILRFEGEKVCDQEVGIISSNLAKCQNLKSLDLEFKYPSHLTDQSLYFLLVGIRNLLVLESLELLFNYGERQFSSQAVSDLVEGLVVLKHLTSLNFFYNYLPIYFSNSAPLPEPLWGYLNMKQITCLSVNHFRYI